MHGAAACTVLASLTFRQHEAPTDMSGVLRSVTALINDEASDPVEDVQISWLGDAIHAEVGSYEIRANVTLSGGARPCYTTLLEVLDTDECASGTPAEWRHACDRSARCVNTRGSYVCACDGDGFAPRDAKYGCGGLSNTSACCGAAAAPASASGGTTATSLAARRTAFEECARSFTCEGDLCASVCAPNAASCRRHVHWLDRATYGEARREARYECACPPGFIGTGRACPGGRAPPTVYVDATGALETASGSVFGRESTAVGDNQCGCPEDQGPCGCQRVVRDPCAGVKCGDHAVCAVVSGDAICQCEPGFTKRDDAAAETDSEPAPATCVDETLPELKLRGAQSVQITQCGAAYDEPGVDVVDENAAAYERTLRIAYSDAAGFPHRDRGGRSAVGKTPYFKLGSYKVTYRVDTPWTRPPFVEAKRRVVVVDEDECALEASHPCAHRCAPVAACVNENGGYRCACPPGTVGDGFADATPSYWNPITGGGMPEDDDVWRVPSSFSRGTGCVDVRPPLLELRGPNPRVLRLERCDAVAQSLAQRFSKKRPRLSASAGTGGASDAIAPSGDVRDALDVQVADLVASAPEVLCDAADPTACFEAADVSPYSGDRLDLADRVVVGAPTRVASSDPGRVRFKIPYSVADDAGNTAVAYRDLVVRTMTLDELAADLAVPETTRRIECPPPVVCPPQAKCPSCPRVQTCPRADPPKHCPAAYSAMAVDADLEDELFRVRRRFAAALAAAVLLAALALAAAVAALDARAQLQAERTSRPPDATPIRLVDSASRARANGHRGTPLSNRFDSPYPDGALARGPRASPWT